MLKSDGSGMNDVFASINFSLKRAKMWAERDPDLAIAYARDAAWSCADLCARIAALEVKPKQAGKGKA